MNTVEATNAEVQEKPALPLKGEVCQQYTRCGKAGCRCGEGFLHGPYYYRIWRDGRHVRKQYVREGDVAAVKAGCAAYREFEHLLRRVRERRLALARSLRSAQGPGPSML